MIPDPPIRMRPTTASALLAAGVQVALRRPLRRLAAGVGYVQLDPLSAIALADEMEAAGMGPEAADVRRQLREAGWPEELCGTGRGNLKGRG